MQQYNIGSLFERIAAKIAGPLPVTEDWNKYMMVVSDYFSKWPKLMPNRTKKSRRLQQLHSDQGRNFKSNLFQNEDCSFRPPHKVQQWHRWHFWLGRSELRRGQCYERNPYAAPVRRLWVLICTTMMSDSSSVMAAGRRSLNKNLEAAVAMGIPEKARLWNIYKGRYEFKSRPRSGTRLFS